MPVHCLHIPHYWTIGGCGAQISVSKRPAKGAKIASVGAESEAAATDRSLFTASHSERVTVIAPRNLVDTSARSHAVMAARGRLTGPDMSQGFVAQIARKRHTPGLRSKIELLPTNGRLAGEGAKVPFVDLHAAGPLKDPEGR